MGKKEEPPLKLRAKKFWLENRVNICCVVATILTLVVWWLLTSRYHYKWEATQEQVEEMRQEIKDVQKKIYQEEQKEERILKKYYNYCKTTQNPPVCKKVASAGLELEETLGFEGLAKLALSLARSEQNYHCPDYNCFGLGAVNPSTWTRFTSYPHAVNALAKLLRDRGYRSITPDDFLKMSYWYKGCEPYAEWSWKLRIMWEEIG